MRCLPRSLPVSRQLFGQRSAPNVEGTLGNVEAYARPQKQVQDADAGNRGTALQRPNFGRFSAYTKVRALQEISESPCSLFTQQSGRARELRSIFSGQIALSLWFAKRLLRCVDRVFPNPFLHVSRTNRHSPAPEIDSLVPRQQMHTYTYVGDALELVPCFKTTSTTETPKSVSDDDDRSLRACRPGEDGAPGVARSSHYFSKKEGKTKLYRCARSASWYCAFCGRHTLLCSLTRINVRTFGDRAPSGSFNPSNCWNCAHRDTCHLILMGTLRHQPRVYDTRTHVCFTHLFMGICYHRFHELQHDLLPIPPALVINAARQTSNRKQGKRRYPTGVSRPCGQGNSSFRPKRCLFSLQGTGKHDSMLLL